MQSNQEGLIDQSTNVITEWAEGSTSHGLPRIARSKNRLIKIMWALFFLASFAYCLYTLVQSFTQYFSYPTTRQISTVRDDLTEFPAVTICNLSPFNYFAKSSLIESILIKNNLTYISNWAKLGIVDAKDPLHFYQLGLNKLNTIISSDYSNNTSFRKSLGFDLETQMLLSCTFNKKPCKASDFTYFWSTKYGNCYTFNTNKYTNGTQKNLLKTSRTGRDYGLRLELLVENPLGYAATEMLAYLAIRNGIYVTVHNSSFSPQLFTDGIMVPAGSDTFIPIKRTLYQRKSKPYSNCVDSLDKFKKINKYSNVLESYMQDISMIDYRQDICFKLCLQDFTINGCYCCDISLPLIRNKSYCRTDSEIDCMTNLTASFSTSNIDALCQYACVPHCDTLKYSLQGHKSLYPSDSYLAQLVNASKYLDSTSAFQLLKLSFRLILASGYGVFEAVQLSRDILVKVTINYDDLTYTLIEDAPLITTETLFGILGGQLGLFIGISFLSLVELIELTYKLIELYVKNKILERKLQPQTPYQYPFQFYAQYFSNYR